MTADADFPREEMARLCLSGLFGFQYTGESLCDEAERVITEPNPRAVRAVALADEIAELLRYCGFQARPSDKPKWRCFHCDEVFASRSLAAAHFGTSEDQSPACQLKASEGGLLRVLRETEDALFEATAALHAESADALKAYRANLTRHATALRAAEEQGYERGLADCIGTNDNQPAVGLTAAEIRSLPTSGYLTLAREIADGDQVMKVYAAVQFDCLDENGQEWLAAIVRETAARATEGRLAREPGA